MRRLDVALDLPASEPGQDVYLCIRGLRRFEEIIRLIREEIDPGQAFIKVPKDK